LPKIYTLGPAPPDNRTKVRSKRRGGFSPRQQAIYRSLVEDAWREVAHDIRDQVAKERWYRDVLHKELGVYTSKQLNKTGDFEKACAAFEVIAGNNIYWQLRVGAGPIERGRRKLESIMREHEIDEAYVRAIANRMFDPNDTGAAHYSNLNANQLQSLIGELEQHFARHVA